MLTSSAKSLNGRILVRGKLHARARNKRTDYVLLVDQTMTNDFKPFGSAMTKIKKRQADKSYEIYLSLYQAVTENEEEQRIYQPPRQSVEQKMVGAIAPTIHGLQHGKDERGDRAIYCTNCPETTSAECNGLSWPHFPGGSSLYG